MVIKFEANKVVGVVMVKLKQRRVQVAEEEAKREKGIQNACDGVQQGLFPSVWKAAAAYGVHHCAQVSKCWKISEISTYASTAIDASRE